MHNAFQIEASSLSFLLFIRVFWVCLRAAFLTETFYPSQLTREFCSCLPWTLLWDLRWRFRAEPERAYFNHQLGSPPDSLTWHPLWTRFVLSPDKIISMTDHYIAADLERSNDLAFI